MNAEGEPTAPSLRKTLSQRWSSLLQDREEQVFLLLTLLIGALVGVTVVVFI